uniref:MD-2-related lipid-recognition domain-containing protein n=1 Tax=Plectus sambesii TaxID=2011161 RepID=A0A914X335_9BILA
MFYQVAAFLIVPVFILPLLSLPVVDAQKDCVPWPNSTEFSPHYFQCDSFSDNQFFTLHEAAITNNTGDDEYPVDLTKTLRVFLDVTNLSGRRYYNLAMDTLFYRRSSGWLGCGWSIIPNFGYLMNKDHCADNPSCPVQVGRQIIEAKIEVSPVFTKYIGLFYGDNIPYQLILRFKDTTDPINQKEVLCVAWQIKATL